MDKKALAKWYAIAAERGDIIAAPAMAALGHLYEDGLGVEKIGINIIDKYQQ